MGKLFSKHFRRLGYRVIVCGLGTKETPRSIAHKADVVMVSVPIEVTVSVIDFITPLLRRDQLLCDLTSIKVKPLEAMMKSKASVIGLHPMFGPTLSSFSGQTIVVCPARPGKWLKWIRSVFHGARLISSTPEKHDQMMAIIQGMLHFTSISMCHALMKLGVDVKESLAYTSPIYRMRLAVVGRILAQDPKMYAQIEIQNPLVGDVLDQLLSSEQELRSIIENKEVKKFEEYFLSAANSLGSYTKEAERYSDFLTEMSRKYRR